MKTIPKLSIITVLRNSSHVFDKFVRNIIENIGVDTELIFVDNHSRDDALNYYQHILEKRIPIGVNDLPRISYRFILNDKNWLFSKATNQGLKEATGEYLTILNPDIYVTKGWDIESIKFLEDNSKVGLIGYKLVKLDGIIEHAGKLDSSGDHRGRGELDSDVIYSVPEVMHNVTFGAVTLSRDLYNIVGELNEKRYPHFCSDVEYCERIKAAGYEVWYMPIRLSHIFGKSCRPYLFNDLPDELMDNGKPARKIWQ